ERNNVSTDEVAANPGRYGLSDNDIVRYRNANRTQDGLLHQLGEPDGETRRYSEISEQERRDKNWRPAMLWAYDPQAFDGKGRAAI
ncbi:alpha/beta hydrolase, partial [Mycobacterium sp. ITM-2017-0098]